MTRPRNDTRFEIIPVSWHAVHRYRERIGCSSKRSNDRIKRTIRHMWITGNPAELAPEHRVSQLLRHGIDVEAEYRLHEGFLLVMVAGEIKTVHRNDHEKWRPV